MNRERAGVRDEVKGCALRPHPNPLPEGEGIKQFIDALYSDISFEVLQSSNLAMAAAVLPICSDLFRICTRSD